MSLTLKIEVLTFSYRDPLSITSYPTLIIPPYTTIYGLLASILGKGANNVKENRKIIKKEIQDKIKEIEVYVSPPENIKKLNIGINRWNADKNKWKKKGWRTIVTQSFLLNYIFYVRIIAEPELEAELKEKITQSKSIYTPYLGSSENLLKCIEIVNDNELDSTNLLKVELEDKIKNGDVILRLQFPYCYDENGNWCMEKFVVLRPKNSI